MANHPVSGAANAASGATGTGNRNDRTGMDSNRSEGVDRDLVVGEAAGLEADPLDNQWLRLEQQVRELIDLTNTLSRENLALRNQQRNWTAERAKLIEKNELAKSRVESMITRLKALEHD